MAPNIILAFDLYGTLLSTESIAKELATHFGEEKAAAVAGQWRRYQLEYTWRLNSMHIYKPFNDITRASLGHALKESGLELKNEHVESLMEAYDRLDTFPEVPEALEAIQNREDIEAYVFSNGTNTMVSSSVNSSPSLSPYSGLFKELVTVEEIRAFKPAPNVYSHLARKVGKEERDWRDIWLVSGNPFDVVGAKAVGFRAIWLDRTGNGWCDGLGGLLGEGKGEGPDLVVKGLGEVVGGIEKFLNEL